MKTVIIGAGVCGLTLGRGLSDRGHEGVIVLEKSRGVGGRMATRRFDGGKFDHGAQFYSLKNETQSLHARWLEAGLTRHYYQHHGVDRYCAPTGMTALAKNLGEGLDIRLEHKLLEVWREADRFRLLIENREALECERLILTCPLPQSIDILRASSVSYEPSLENLRYAKALVALFEGVETSSALTLAHGYLEKPGRTQIFSLADQGAKGLTTTKAWTVTMDDDFSEECFDQPEESVLARVVGQIRGLDPKFKFTGVQLKKWRYAHPLSTYNKNYLEVANRLFLAGDAFGGPSLVGAARSAGELLLHLSTGEGAR